jgi:hypothetical protein
MNQFQLNLDETLCVGIEMEEEFSARLDVAPFRGRGGQAIQPEAVNAPWWATCEGEPGSLFDRVPRPRRAA